MNFEWARQQTESGSVGNDFPEASQNDVDIPFRQSENSVNESQRKSSSAREARRKNDESLTKITASDDSFELR